MSGSTYYAALIAAWNGTTQPPTGVTGMALTSTMTTAEKITAVNGWTVAGPNQNVSIASVIRYLGLNLKLAGLQRYASAALASTATLTEAQVAGSEFAAVLACPNAAPFQAGDAASIEALLTEIASDSNSGLTTTDVTNLMALFATTTPWWQAPVANGGGGLSSPVGLPDCQAAGIS